MCGGRGGCRRGGGKGGGGFGESAPASAPQGGGLLGVSWGLVEAVGGAPRDTRGGVDPGTVAGPRPSAVVFGRRCRAHGADLGPAALLLCQWCACWLSGCYSAAPMQALLQLPCVCVCVCVCVGGWVWVV